MRLGTPTASVEAAAESPCVDTTVSLRRPAAGGGSGYGPVLLELLSSLMVKLSSSPKNWNLSRGRVQPASGISLQWREAGVPRFRSFPGINETFSCACPSERHLSSLSPLFSLAASSSTPAAGRRHQKRPLPTPAPSPFHGKGVARDHPLQRYCSGASGWRRRASSWHRRR